MTVLSQHGSVDLLTDQEALANMTTPSSIECCISVKTVTNGVSIHSCHAMQTPLPRHDGCGLHAFHSDMTSFDLMDSALDKAPDATP